MSVTQPAWHPPPPLEVDAKKSLPEIVIYNSLTRSKTPFVPIDRSGKKITWYSCGPTVYDDSHLGHARNYVSTDIVRRILQDYFRFDLTFVMNITDVDDKIILAARQQHLLAKWMTEHRDPDDLTTTIQAALRAYVAKNLPLLDSNIEPVTKLEAIIGQRYGHVIQGKSLANDNTPPGDREAKVKMHIKTVSSALEALRADSTDLNGRYSLAAGVLLPYIDSKEATTISGKDHDIFTKLTRKYEERFFDDMRALNVLYPDDVTRVTEYGKEIVEFVEQIQKNGFAYENEGSVYYDVHAWEAAGGHYARLEPWNRNDQELQADGEGALSTKKVGFKRSGADFALWKASKTGEPSWPSPWGEGRPGWHIECSAMASKVLGKSIDIHSGGIDLAFPHHDNELAQSEAYWCDAHHISECGQWINYFIHTGHLSIQGSKMSKSLKNFTTIKEALAKGDWTPRGLRILFLLGPWRDGLEITPAVVKSALAWEEKTDNFFLKARDLQRRSQGAGIDGEVAELSVNESDDLATKLKEAQEKFHSALCDSFDTPTAMRIISELLTAVNSEKHVTTATLLSIGKWVTDMVVMFGLDAQPETELVGWSGLELSPKALSVIEPLAAARDDIRSKAIAGTMETSELPTLPPLPADGTIDDAYVRAYTTFADMVQDLKQKRASPKDWLAACDILRDDILWRVNVSLEDREGQPALVRPLSTSLRQERKDREAVTAAKLAAKQKAKADADAAEKEKLAKAKVSHLEMFRTSEYSEWDADGMPVKDSEGAELPKSRTKKLKKDWERQKKLHEAYLATQSK